ncbi:hypothetical protein I3842_07G162700 [Carya illinoinensis]|uniref:Uncharacterized protein n=1 Tax=Carya illinoinensis TaxID=32201 RepID=A0A922EN39_CARIL|nr:hypothetical protein I3842_07G162700 [Carya illinoinensis]
MPRPDGIGVWLDACEICSSFLWPFVNGGTSCMLTTCVIQPIDMIKVRIQLG